MAGTTVESELTAAASKRVRFALATARDDAAIRRLLRDNPLRGAISVSLEREPDYFRGLGLAGADDQVILAVGQGRLACMGRCTVRDGYVNGEARRIGYLSELRLDSRLGGRFDILRRGYQFFHDLQQTDPADVYFTSITEDNVRSLRFLRRGLPGMPVYGPIAEFVTLFVPVPRRTIRMENVVAASDEHLAGLVEFLNGHARRSNLTTVWTGEKIRALERHGLRLSDFQLVMAGGRIVGCAAWWDQRAFKQTVIRGYGRGLSLARPWLNALAAIARTPGLPAVNSPLAYGFLSPLVTAPEAGETVAELVDSALSIAAARGLNFVALGFSATDPRCQTVQKRFRCREYRNHLFQVQWNDFPTIDLDERLIFPEVALL